MMIPLTPPFVSMALDPALRTLGFAMVRVGVDGKVEAARVGRWDTLQVPGADPRHRYAFGPSSNNVGGLVAKFIEHIDPWLAQCEGGILVIEQQPGAMPGGGGGRALECTMNRQTQSALEAALLTRFGKGFKGVPPQIVSVSPVAKNSALNIPSGSYAERKQHTVEWMRNLVGPEHWETVVATFGSGGKADDAADALAFAMIGAGFFPQVKLHPVSVTPSFHATFDPIKERHRTTVSCRLVGSTFGTPGPLIGHTRGVRGKGGKGTPPDPPAEEERGEEEEEEPPKTPRPRRRRPKSPAPAPRRRSTRSTRKKEDGPPPPKRTRAGPAAGPAPPKQRGRRGGR